MSGSSYHGLSINGPKAKVVADIQACSIGHPVISTQYVRVGGVGNQVLYISPCQIRTEGRESKCTLYSLLHIWLYCFRPHFACKTSAMTPDTRGADALVPVKSSVHSPYREVV